MKTLRIRSQRTVADPLQAERVLKALTIILEHQEDPNASRLLYTLSNSTFSTTDGPCCRNMSIAMMASAEHDWTARRWTGCVMRPRVGSSMPW